MAAAGQGSACLIGIGEETPTWGSAATRTGIVHVERAGLKNVEEKIESQPVYRVGQDSLRVKQGRRLSRGPIGLTCTYGGYWLKFLKHLMGAVATATPDPTNAANVRIHTLTPAAGLPYIGLTVEVVKDIESIIYPGCCVDSMDFSVSENGALMSTVNLLGKTGTPGSATIPGILATTATEMIVGVEAALTWNNVSVVVPNFSFNVANGLGFQRGIGSRDVTGVRRTGKRVVSGTFTAEYDSDDLYDDFIAATRRSLVLTCTGPTAQGAYPFKVTFTMPVTEIRGDDPEISGPGPITISVPFVSMISASYADELTVAVQNLDATL